MKAFTVVLFSLSISLTAFASQTITGNDGDTVMSALSQAGSVMDCGGGTCGTAVQDVVCRADKRVTGSQSCKLTVQTESGNQSDLQTVTGDKANGLIDVLSTVGAYECGSENCEGYVISIECTIPNDPDGASASCTIHSK